MYVLDSVEVCEKRSETIKNLFTFCFLIDFLIEGNCAEVGCIYEYFQENAS